MFQELFSPSLGLKRCSLANRGYDYSMVRTLALTAVLLIITVLLAGCAPHHMNRELQQYNPNTGYRLETLQCGPGNTDETFVCLSFSGGGIRAASLAYGVLLRLRDTPIAGRQADGSSRRLLDEVDVISSVSGGSFTAVSYGLRREQLFDGWYRQRFLMHNIQRDLLLQCLWPQNLLYLPFVLLDRIDIAATYYHENIFDQNTYQALLGQATRPYIVVNATHQALRQRFEFTQDDFDIMGSDLSSLPLGSAVAASSAFPFLFSPIRLRYYVGPASTAAITDILGDPQSVIQNRRRCRWANNLVTGSSDWSINAPQHRYCYLLDGGLADNLGLEYIVDSYQYGAIREMIEAGEIKKLVVIMVDAKTESETDLECQGTSPGLGLVALATGTTSMENYSTALADMVRYNLGEGHQKLRQAYGAYQQTLDSHNIQDNSLVTFPEKELECYFIEVSFRVMQDEQEKKNIMSLVTSLFLPGKDVKKLIDLGSRLPLNDPEFQRLVKDLQEPKGTRTASD